MQRLHIDGDAMLIKLSGFDGVTPHKSAISQVPKDDTHGRLDISFMGVMHKWLPCLFDKVQRAVKIKGRTIPFPHSHITHPYIIQVLLLISKTPELRPARGKLP